MNKLSLREPASPLGHTLFQKHQPIIEYLLEKEADTAVDVFSVPLLENAAYNTPGNLFDITKAGPQRT